MHGLVGIWIRFELVCLIDKRLGLLMPNLFCLFLLVF